MAGILAIETATDACSVAVYRDGIWQERHEITPRAHNQRLFVMLRELFPDGDLRAAGVEAVAYGCGPGSFTGLRIAASAVQGIAFAHELPAIPVSTLASQAQTALRSGIAEPDEYILSTIDARIGELYYAVYRQLDGLVDCVQQPTASTPGDVQLGEEFGEVLAVGSGCEFAASFPDSLSKRLRLLDGSIVPRARDLVPLALAMLKVGNVQSPAQVQPVYVRDEISWKKLSEQGSGR